MEAPCRSNGAYGCDYMAVNVAFTCDGCAMGVTGATWHVWALICVRTDLCG